VTLPKKDPNLTLVHHGSGADVVEVSPPYDHGMLCFIQLPKHLITYSPIPAEITGFAAAEVTRDLLYLLRSTVLRPVVTRDEL
jgi:arginase family enzyme